MIHGYTEDMDVCPICDGKTATTRILAMAPISGHPTESIAYPVCRRCEKKVKRGLSSDALQALERRLLSRAAELGFGATQSEGRRP